MKRGGQATNQQWMYVEQWMQCAYKQKKYRKYNDVFHMKMSWHKGESRLNIKLIELEYFVRNPLKSGGKLVGATVCE